MSPALGGCGDCSHLSTPARFPRVTGLARQHAGPFGCRCEFVTGRACARRALARLGVEPVPVPSGDRGEPFWPDGIVGSITHCDEYRACAAARRRMAAAIRETAA